MGSQKPLPVIHLVDDDSDFQTAISRLLKAVGYKVYTYSSAGDFLLSDIMNQPGCILLDIRMPGPSGLELQDALAEKGILLPVIFLSGHGDIPITVKAIQAGAVDFLTKPVERDTLFDAIKKALVIYEEKYTLREHQSALLGRFQSLSKREIEVFQGVIMGNRNKEIASKLGMAERTVKLHRAHVMEKMGADSLAELVRISDQLGMANNSRMDLPPTN